MAIDKQAEQALALFRSFRSEESARSFDAAAAPTGGGEESGVTVPHPYYHVSGADILNGSLAGAEKLVGYQSLIFEGQRAMEAPIASSEGEGMGYVASWTSEAAAALNEAVGIAESAGRDMSDFAVVTVPEVGFNAVWLREQHELIPLATTLARSSLDPTRIYSEEEVIERLREPLSERITSPVGGGEDDELEEPPMA